MDRFFKVIARFPKTAILFVIVATACISLPIRTLHLETDAEAMMPYHHPVFVYNREVEEIFGTRKLIIVGVVHEGPNGVFNPRTLKLVEQLSLKIEEMDGIIGDDVVSLRMLDNIVGTEWGLDVIRLMETAPTDPADALGLREAVLDNEMFINNVVSPDGTATAIFAKLDKGANKIEMYNRIRRIIHEDVDLGDNLVIIAGRAVIEGTIGKYAADDMRRTFPLVVMVSLLVLFLTMRSLRGVLLPLATVIASVLWTLGIMGLLRIPLYAVTTIVPVLLVAIGLAYGIHIINRYDEEVALMPQSDRKQIVLTTMHEMWGPVMMASLTTAAGFLSLATSDMVPVKYLGIFVAIGVISALLFSLTFIPAWLVLLPVKRREEDLDDLNGNLAVHHDWVTRGLLHAGNVIGGYPRSVLVVWILVILIGIVGLLRVYVDGSLLQNFQPGSDVLVADTVLTEKFGGTNQLSIVVEGKNQDDIKSPELLRAIEELQTKLGNMDEVGATLSIADYIKRMNRVMNENRKEFLRIPDSRDLVAQYLLLYSMSGDPDDFDDFVDYDYRLANVRIRINSDHSTVLKKVIDQVRALSASIFGRFGMEVKLAGTAMTAFTFMNLIVRGQILSILAAIVMVFIITSFMFRTTVAGIFCIIPVGVATMLNFSLMGAFGVPLGVTTALLSSMGIGIGVDYAIHFVARYRRLSKVTMDRKERIQRTLGTAGRAILFNALVVTAGFLVLLISNFPPSRWLSSLVSVNMVSCFLGAVTVLPACLAVFKPKFADTPGMKAAARE